MVDKYFAAFRFAGRNMCCRYPDHLGDDISCCLGSEDVPVVGWVPELPEWQPKLRELHAVYRTVLLQER